MRRGEYLKQHGLRWSLRRLTEKSCELYLGTLDRSLLEQAAPMLLSDGEELLISVAIPVYNPRPEWLRELGESMLAQSWPHWEACLYDGRSTREGVRQVLEELERKDARFRVCFGESNDGISGNTNRAIAMARGSYVVLCDHDDLLTADALACVAEAVQRTGAELLYSDEDRLQNGHHLDAHLKPDWSPDNLCSANYCCHLAVISRDLLTRVGGLRPAFDGSQDHDLTLRCSEPANRVEHIPRILYHWRNTGESMSHQHLEKCLSASARAVQEHMIRLGYGGTAAPEGEIIRLHWALSRPMTVEALITAVSPEKAAACAASLHAADGLTLRCTPLVGTDRRQLLDAAAAASSADLLLIMDASVRPAEENFLLEAASLAQRDFTGLVFPTVTDRRGRILHAGYAVMADGRVLLRNQGLLQRAGGRNMQELYNHNVIAGSTRCCMLKRSLYQPMQGLSDTEWCLRIPGYHVVAPWARCTADKRFEIPEPMEQPVRDPYMHPAYARGKKADFRIPRR